MQCVKCDENIKFVCSLPWICVILAEKSKNQETYVSFGLIQYTVLNNNINYNIGNFLWTSMHFYSGKKRRWRKKQRKTKLFISKCDDFSLPLVCIRFRFFTKVVFLYVKLWFIFVHQHFCCLSLSLSRFISFVHIYSYVMCIGVCWACYLHVRLCVCLR